MSQTYAILPAPTGDPSQGPASTSNVQASSVTLQDLRTVKSALDNLLDVFRPMGRLASLSDAALVVLEEAMARVQQIASMPLDHSVAEILYNPVLLVDFLRRIPGGEQMTGS